jgi:NTP pyrophosphatase (non-canonical NTP hydrolase)
MDFNEYQALANRTAKMLPTVAQNLMHAQVGLATETGEFATVVKRIAIYEKPVTDEMLTHMAEELGDTLWYIALAAETLGISMHQMAHDNIAKLQARFPEKYSNAAAEARADKGGADARSS